MSTCLHMKLVPAVSTNVKFIATTRSRLDQTVHMDGLRIADCHRKPGLGLSVAANENILLAH